MSRKKREIKVFSSSEFTGNTDMFNTLMKLQYGDGAESVKAGEVLFTKKSGIVCKRIEDLGIVLPSVDLLLSLNTDKSLRYTLYINVEMDSLYCAKLFQYLRFEVKIVYEDDPKGGVLPALDDLELPERKTSLKEIKRFLRHFIALVAPSEYRPTHKKIGDSNWCTNSKGKSKVKVLCFDQHCSNIFEGPFDESSYPVVEMLSEHFYVKRGREFQDIVVWGLGDWNFISKNKIDQNSHFIQQFPPAVLFADELKAFSDGKKKLITNEHGCAYCVEYDGYFIKKGCLYRIHAEMND